MLKLAIRTAIRSIVRRLFEAAVASPTAKIKITRIAKWLKGIPLGVDLGSEIINDFDPTLRSVVEPIWISIVHGTVTNDHPMFDKNQSDDDMIQGICHSLSEIYSLPEMQRGILFEKLQAVSTENIEQTLYLLAGLDNEGLMNFVVQLQSRGEDAEIQSTFLMIGQNLVNKARQVSAWLCDQYPDAYQKIQMVLTAGNDAKLQHNKRRLEQFYGSLYEIGQKSAVSQLKAIASIPDVADRARAIGLDADDNAQLLAYLNKSLRGRNIKPLTEE